MQFRKIENQAFVNKLTNKMIQIITVKNLNN